MRLFERGDHEPTNIGNPVEFTVSELAETVVKLVSVGTQIVYKPLPTDDPKVRCPDISKAKAELEWEPQVTLEEGLNRTIEFFRKSLEL